MDNYTTVSHPHLYGPEHENCDFPLSEEDNCNTIRLIKQIIFSISISMDVIALFILILYRKYTSFSQRIFLNILLCNLVEGIAHLLDDGKVGQKCLVAAFFVQTAGFALFMWVCALSLFLFLLIIKKKNTSNCEISYILVCYGIPVITGIIPFITGDYGPAGAFCWVEKDALRFAIWWVPVPIGMVLILIAFIIMIVKTVRKPLKDVSERMQKENKRLIKNYLQPLAGYGVTFFILHSIMFTERLTTLSGKTPIFAVKILQIICISSYGTILCTLFYVTNGSKGLSKEKLEIALKEHKYHLCRKSRRAMVRTMSIMGADSETHVGNRVTTNIGVAVISGAPALANNPQPDLNLTYTTESKKPKSILKKSKTKSSKVNNTSLSLTIQSCSEAKYLDPRYLEHPVAKSKTKSTAESLGFELTELERPQILDETLDSEEKTSESETKTLSAEEDFSLECSLGLNPGISYKHPRSSEMVKIYLSDINKQRWEAWKNNQTLASWVLSLQKSLNTDLRVTVFDQEGASFGQQITWQQIKSCTDSIRIVVNKGVTEVVFTPKLEDLSDITEESESS